MQAPRDSLEFEQAIGADLTRDCIERINAFAPPPPADMATFLNMLANCVAAFSPDPMACATAAIAMAPGCTLCSTSNSDDIAEALSVCLQGVVVRSSDGVHFMLPGVEPGAGEGADRVSQAALRVQEVQSRQCV